MKLATTSGAPRKTHISLRDAALGGEFRIASVSGPVCEKLRDMGFCESLIVRKLSNGRNLLCTVCGCRLALSRELAQHVMVTSAAEQ